MNTKGIEIFYEKKWKGVHLDVKEALGEIVPYEDTAEVNIAVRKDTSHATDLIKRSS